MVDEVKTELRLDFGCGKNKIVEAGKVWTGVDSIAFPGVDVVLDLTAKESSVQNPDYSVTHTYKAWPWSDNSVDEIHCSHFLEHLNGPERIHFCNETYRVLKPNGQCRIIVPHFASCRAYGDLTHQWPPVSDFFWYYLSASWREQNAPHNLEYKCDFSATWGFSLHPAVQVRNSEYQNFALQNFKEAAQDMIATLVKVEANPVPTYP